MILRGIASLVGFTVFILLVVLSVWATLEPSSLGRPVVPCTTDLDCHIKNPGLCPDDQPYCF